MRTVALAVAVAACGGAAPQPETIRRSEPDKAAIAPPPPVPDVPVEETSAEEPAKKQPWAPPPSGLDFADVVGAPANAPLKGSVLVWADATFYLAPKEGAPTLKLATLASRKEHLGEAVPMRVRSAKGGFVEVEASQTDELRNYVHDCAWFAMTSQMHVGPWRLYVKRDDIAPVLTKSFAQTFADGSRIEVEPGMPVAPLADGKTVVGFKSLWIPVALPPASIGYSYPTPSQKPDKPFDPEHRLEAGEVAVADARIALRTVFAPLAAAVETNGDRVAFPIGDECGRATVIANATDVLPYEKTPAGGMFGSGIGVGTIGSMMGSERWYLPKGTRLVAEGAQASTTITYEQPVKKPAAGEKQVCIERFPYIASAYLLGPKLQTESVKPLRMCAPVRAVKHDKAKPGFGYGGSKGPLKPTKPAK